MTTKVRQGRIVSCVYTILLFIIITSCVDPIAFNVPEVGLQLVVDGSITDQPGPYTVYLTRARELKFDLDVKVGVPRAVVIIRSDAGEEEQLTEVSRGMYQTQNLQGVAGRSYWLIIQTEDGMVYTSDPEKLNAAGELDAIKPRFQEDEVFKNGVEVNADRFDILVDATGSSETENYYRWRTTGTYLIHTLPHLKTFRTPDGIPVPAPAPCSGYVLREGILTQVGPCTCCYCWVTVQDRYPHVYDDVFTASGSFRNVNIGAVPINERTFFERYHLSVEQIRLNKKAFDYFKGIKAQKEGAASLFQPASGKLKGNVHQVGSDEEVLGYFWVGGVRTRSIFIEKSDVPYRVPPIDSMKYECYLIANSVTTKPAFWPK